MSHWHYTDVICVLVTGWRWHRSQTHHWRLSFDDLILTYSINAKGIFLWVAHTGFLVAILIWLQLTAQHVKWRLGTLQNSTSVLHVCVYVCAPVCCVFYCMLLCVLYTVSCALCATCSRTGKKRTHTAQSDEDHVTIFIKQVHNIILEP